MKGLILGILWFVIFLILTRIVCQARRWAKPFYAFVGMFALNIPLYIVAYLVTPANLFFLPLPLVEPCTTLDFCYGLAVCVLLFHCFWDFAYAAAMGFSTGIMVELKRAGAPGLSTEELLAGFRTGGAVDKVLARRLDNIVRGGYAAREGSVIRLNPKGRLLSRAVWFLKWLICAGEGG